MLVGLSGPTTFYDVGDRYDCDDSEAARLIGARFAVPWTEPEIERAVVTPPETRVTRAKRKK